MSMKNELGIFVKHETPIVSSREVAKVFGKRHDNVLREIENLECTEVFRLLNFEESFYKNSQNKNQPEYLMTKDGFIFLVMGFTGKEAAEFKEKYIAAFNYMYVAIKSRQDLKTSFRPMTDAIKGAHKTPKLYHYTNEINMIYKIVLGKDAKQFRTDESLDEDTDLRDYITNKQKKMVDKLQLVNTGLIEIGMNYQERKERLTALYLKDVTKLSEPYIMAITA